MVVPLLLVSGVVLSYQSGMIQFRCRKVIWKEVFGKFKQKDVYGISSWQALATALASTIGTGNITGVATAIAFGGPGAIFWMWVGGFLGMATKYGEIVLAIGYRKGEKGKYYGGPMYYMEYGLGRKGMGMLFALCTLGASFGIGNMTQANSIAVALRCFVPIEAEVVGIILLFAVAPILLGGIGRIARVNGYFVPIMAGFYLLVCGCALFFGEGDIGDLFCLILQEAFSMQAVGGSAAGYGMFAAMRYGLARGIFSNEAGLGSAPIAHSMADCKSAVGQGMWGILEVMVTMVICTLTALVVLQSGLYRDGILLGTDLAIGAFERALPYGMGQWVVALASICFAFSSILGWFYYGEQALKYLCGSSLVFRCYTLLYCWCIYQGACGEIDVLWRLADGLNGCMALPNLVALLLLSKEVKEESERYFESLNR